MKQYLIGIVIGLMVMGGVWYFVEHRGEKPEHDYQSENEVLIKDNERHEAAELFHKNRADKAEHFTDSLLAIKPKIIFKYHEKDHSITLLNADSTHSLLLSNAQNDSIWK